MSTKEKTLSIVNDIVKNSPILSRELGDEPLTEANLSRLADAPYDALNEFVGAILKITKQYAYTTIFERAMNPFSMFFREKLEAGFTISDLYTKLFTGHAFDYTGANALARVKPTVEEMFYSVNKEMEYDISVSLEQSRTAFLSVSGIEQFMSTQYASMYSSAERDIWKWCLGIFSDVYVGGDYHSYGVSAINSDTNIKAFLEKTKNVISDFQFIGNGNNPLSTDVISRPEDILVVMPASVKNKVDVQTLAGAFNLDKIAIENQIITVPDTDGFGKVMSSTGTLAVIVDRNFFRIFPQTFDALSQLNASGFFTNTHLLSRWIFSYGRFYNIARIYDDDATYTYSAKVYKNGTEITPTTAVAFSPASPQVEGTDVTITVTLTDASEGTVSDDGIHITINGEDCGAVEFTKTTSAGVTTYVATVDQLAGNVVYTVNATL